MGSTIDAMPSWHLARSQLHPNPLAIPQSGVPHSKSMPIPLPSLVPNHMKPHLYAWAAFFSFAVLISCVKGLHSSVPVPLIIAIRSLLGVLVLTPLIIKAGGLRSNLQTAYPWQQILRACCGAFALGLNFYALPRLPLADAQGLNQLYPVFLVVLAPFILGEYAGWRQWLALVIGLSGALLIAQPHGQGAMIPTLCVMGSALASAIGDLLARFMGRKDSALTITLWLFLCLGGGMLVWWLIMHGPQPLSVKQISLLTIIGVAGAVAQLAMVQAFKFLPAATMAVYSSLGLLWAVVFGFLFFAETPGWWLVAGAALILIAAYIASWTRPARAPVVDKSA